MNILSLSRIKKELQDLSHAELMALSLTLIKHKKENKELVSYSLTHTLDKMNYVEELKSEMDEFFAEVTAQNIYLFKKTLRKILRWTKKYIKFNDSKLVEVELLIHFCNKLLRFSKYLNSSKVIQNIFKSQLKIIETNIDKFHDDLKYDYDKMIEPLKAVKFSL